MKTILQIFIGYTLDIIERDTYLRKKKCRYPISAIESSTVPVGMMKTVRMKWTLE